MAGIEASGIGGDARRFSPRARGVVSWLVDRGRGRVVGICHRRDLRVARGAGTSMELAGWTGKQRFLLCAFLPRTSLRRHEPPNHLSRSRRLWLVELGFRRKKPFAAEGQSGNTPRMDCVGGGNSPLHLGDARNPDKRKRRSSAVGRIDDRAEFGRAISSVPKTF